ncbi:MAG: PQQ-binding-like beta-propeller repeat protein [Bacteroidota bacterium]
MSNLIKLSSSLVWLFLLGMLPFTVFSQEKKWEVDLKSQLFNVSWIQQSNDGMIIAAGDKGLLALNNETGETAWHNKELKAIDKNSFLNVDGLPLFYVDYAPMMGKTRGLLINSSTGDIVMDSKDEGYKIKNFNIYPGAECILFEASRANEKLLIKFSLKTWEEEWTTTIGELKGLVGKLKGEVATSFIDHGPYFTKDGQLILGAKSQVFAINNKTGTVSWSKETDKKIKALVYSDLNNSLYLGIRKSKKLTVLKPSTGDDITPGKLKLRGSLLDVRPDENNNLILVETEGFNLIDPKSDEFKWKKSYKIDYLDEVIPYKDQYIAIGKDEKDGGISLVDKDGKKVWDSKVKGYAYYATPTPKGIMYISTQRSNVLSYKDGKDLWKKDVKFKSIPAITYDEKADKVIIFENKKGYKFGLGSGSIDQFAEDVELKDVDKKTPLTAEYVEGGYFIGTDQHASLLSPSGKVVYSEYFEPVSSIGGLMNIAEMGVGMATGIDLDIQGSMDNINALNSLANGSYRTAGDQNDATSQTSVVAGMYVGNGAAMAPVFEVTKTRYFNSKDTKDAKFLTTKAADGNFVYVLNKNTGKIDQKIKLADKTPDYVIDEIDNRVFLNEKNHLITCYQL